VVTEGTWLNIDVSPDGQTLLFDLLGDLYTLPINGGKSTLLKGGVAFDRQARYSPNGQQIIYTSDASGCHKSLLNPLIINMISCHLCY